MSIFNRIIVIILLFSAIQASANRFPIPDIETENCQIDGCADGEVCTEHFKEDLDDPRNDISYYTCDSRSKKQLNISTFNIKWYGLGGEFSGLESDEYRDPWIREFLDKELATRDVILFQEIVNVERFRDQVIRSDMDCVTYNHSSPKHQHIVLCYKSHLKFVTEFDDDNFALESVATNPEKSRPGLHGLLLDEDSAPLVHIIGLHLKAFPQETEKRLEQVKQVAHRIQSIKDNTPIVVLGDFNAHKKEDTNLDTDDWVLMDRIFKSKWLKIKHVRNRNENTFRISGRGYHLDHIWVSNNIHVDQPAKVSKACNSSHRGTERFDNYLFYNRFISDHCPVSVNLEF